MTEACAPAIKGRPALPDRLALALAIIIALLALADLVFDDATALMFLARKFLAFVEWLSFWR